MAEALEGGRALEALLAQLPGNVARRAGRSALRKGAVPIRDEAQRLAPNDPETPNAEDPGDLPTSIAISASQQMGGAVRRTREGADSVTVYVGPTKIGYPQAMVKEFGGAKRDGTVVEATPYMRPAWDSEAGNALNIIRAELGPEAIRAAERLARKTRLKR